VSDGISNLVHKTIKQDWPIASIFVDEALQCGRNAGVDVSDMLESLGIEQDRLYGLTAQEFSAIWLELSARMQDEFFGLGKRAMRPGSFTLLGHAVCGASSFRIALERKLRFLRVVLEEPYGVLEVNDTLCSVRLYENGPTRTAFAYRTFFLFVHGFNCWYVNERIPLKGVSFPCPEPEGSNDYGDFFGVPVTFDADAASLEFDSKYLDRSVKRNEKELKLLLRNCPEAFLRGYRDTVGIKRLIVDRCLSGDPQDWPTAAQIATQLVMSRSTLHRLLNDAGQSIHQIKEEQRHNRAVHLLQKSDMSVTDIAYKVGYSEQSTFFRAFARWYGTTPGQFRRSRKTKAVSLQYQDAIFNRLL